MAAVSKIPARPGWTMGVDVSQFQAKIDWSALPGNIEFAFIRATDGITVDKRYKDNAAGCKAPWGAYHALEPGRDPVEAAKLFSATVEERNGLPAVLDFEVAARSEPAEHVLARAFAWRDYIEQDWNRPIIIYTGPAFWMELSLHHADTAAFARNRLWVAHYTNSYDRMPWVPAPWKQPKQSPHDPDTGWTFWQCSGGKKASRNAAQLPNRQDVDVDWFNGSKADLLAL